MKKVLAIVTIAESKTFLLVKVMDNDYRVYDGDSSMGSYETMDMANNALIKAMTYELIFSHS